jgi:hypothetical protein
MSSVTLDVGVDISVQVRNVKQLLEVIRSDLSLDFERTFRPSADIAGLHWLGIVSSITISLRLVGHLIPPYSVQISAFTL